MTATIEAEQHAAWRDALVGRLTEATLGTMDLLTAYIGERVGLYQALAELGEASSTELATRTGTTERYVREWLEQQASTGIVHVDSATDEASARRYRLPAAHQEVLLDRDSLYFLGGMVRAIGSVGRALPAVAEAFRTGGGVPYAVYGADAVEGVAAMNRPQFLNLLGAVWLPAIPDVDARLRADPPAHVVDVGCGAGWSTIALARAYPNARVHGFDLDEPSIELARQHAAAEGLADRVTFAVRDAASPGLAGSYDLVTAFETVHDMARPVEALRKMREMVKPGGTVIVADEKVGERFSAPGDEIERLNYGFSVLHCLPVAMADQPSAATGTVMRPETMRRYAAEAGFRAVEVLPVEHDLWRFYRLEP